MRRNHLRLARSFLPSLLALSAFPASHAPGASGTWTNLSGGLWSATANWASATVANGTDATADFATLNITSNLIVHLDSSRSIGTLLFADKTLNDHTWTLDNNSNTANILLLDTSSGTPVVNVANSSLAANLTLSGSKGLDKEGIGTLLLNLPATYSGNTTIGAGAITLGVTNALPTVTSLSLSASATLNLNGHNQFLAHLSGNGTISNPGAVANLANLTIIPTAAGSNSQNLISGNISLVKSGPNTLILGGTPSTYFGSTHITAGTLIITGTNILPTSTALTIDPGATFDISIQSQTVASLDGAGTVKPSFLVGTRGTLTVNTNGGIVTSPTLLTGHMNFIKDGNGFLTFTTPATYDGNTTISNGAFFSGVTNALPVTTPLTIASPADLDLSGHNLQVGLLSGAGALINQSATPATFTLTPDALTPDVVPTSLQGNLSLNIPNPCNITLTSACFYTGSTTVGSANTTLTSGITDALPVTTSLSLAGTFDLNGNDQQLPAVTGNGTITNSAATPANFELTTPADATLTAHITGNINFTKSGPARLLVSTPLTHTGFTTLSEGTLAIGANNSLPASTTLFMNPGTTFDLNSKSQQFKSLVGSGTIIDSTEPNSLFVSLDVVNSTDDVTFATINAPQLELFKDGNGALTFGGQVHAGFCFFNAGSVQFSAPGNQVDGSVIGNGQLTVAAGASLTTVSLSYFSVSINGAFDFNPNVFSVNPSSVSNQANCGSHNNWTGKLDLANHILVVRISPSLSTLQNLVAFGRTHNAGITNSILAPNFGIAVFSNTVTNFTIFRGSAVNPSDLLIAPELLGDANIDGHVDLTDLSTILNHFGTTTPNWTDGNFDYAQTIDLTDLSAVLNNFGLSNPNAAASLSVATPAPEPASLALLALFAPLLRRRNTP